MMLFAKFLFPFVRFSWSLSLIEFYPCLILFNQYQARGSDSNLLIVFYVQIMPDDLVMQLHRF